MSSRNRPDLPRPKFEAPKTARRDENPVDIDPEALIHIFTTFKPKTALLRTPLQYDTPRRDFGKELCKIQKGFWTIQKNKALANRNIYTLTPLEKEVRRLLWLFHTNWILRRSIFIVNEDKNQNIHVASTSRPAIKSSEDSNPSSSSSSKSDSGLSFIIEWVKQCLRQFEPIFKEMLKGKRYGTFNLELGPKDILDMFLRGIVAAAGNAVMELATRRFKACQAIDDWIDKISEAIELKEKLMEKAELLAEKYIHMPPKLDESSIWGLKPLRILQSPPYFKTEDGFVAGPPHPATIVKEFYSGEAFFNFTKQKWTRKDMAAVRQAVREVLIEKYLLRIRTRANILLRECQLIHDEQVNQELLKEQLGIEDKVVQNKPIRGRPRRRNKKSPYLATLAPHLFTIDGDCGPIVFRGLVTNNDIEEWQDSEEDKVNQLGLKALLEKVDVIEWVAVSNKVVEKTKKDRSAHDCLLAFQCEGDPRINTDRWTSEEAKKLMSTVLKLQRPNWCENDEPVNVAWDRVAAEVGNRRTAFQCFYRWRNTVCPPKKMKWNQQKDNQVAQLIMATEANWKKVMLLSGDELATKKQIIDRYKKNSNEVFRSGPFCRAEDALLLITIEKLKGQLKREGHFGELIAYLPWRFETVWRDRAGNLFSDWIVPWTIEEDKKLLELAEKKKRNWREIASSFTSFKNRKGCLTRWKILQKRLATFNSLEEYHEAYAMIRYNVFQYQHLEELLVLLKKLVFEPQVEFHGFKPGCPPTEEDLQDFLLSYDRSIIAQTIRTLEEYINRRNAFWKTQMNVPNERIKTFDRRTFRPELAQSVASALHIRGVKLIPKDKLKFKKIKPFEEDVYKFYARFTRTKPLNRKCKRPYLPTADELIKMASVKRIVEKKSFTKKKSSTKKKPVKMSKAKVAKGKGRNKKKIQVKAKAGKKAPPPKVMIQNTPTELVFSDANNEKMDYEDSPISSRTRSKCPEI